MLSAQARMPMEARCISVLPITCAQVNRDIDEEIRPHLEEVQAEGRDVRKFGSSLRARERFAIKSSRHGLNRCSPTRLLDGGSS
jgi:hypothetical protein